MLGGKGTEWDIRVPVLQAVHCKVCANTFKREIKNLKTLTFHLVGASKSGIPYLTVRFSQEEPRTEAVRTCSAGPHLSVLWRRLAAIPSPWLPCLSALI